MKKVVKNSKDKYVSESTFEKHMGNIAKSFNRVDDTLEVIIRELRDIKDEQKGTRKDLASFATDVLRHDRRIEDLTIRVEKLEAK
jgi:phage shock protein A